MENIPQKNSESRVSVIESIKTPLGLAALVVFLIEVILTILATKATGNDFTILVIAMPAILLALLVFAFFTWKGSVETAPTPARAVANPQIIKHELFISSPMAAYSTNEAYKQNREEVLKLVNAFRKECQFKSVVFAGKELESMDDFEAADISAQDDVNALKESRYFVLYYTEKVVSSVLFEAGMALALRKPSLYLVRNRKDLPFIMREAEQAFPSYVKIYEESMVDEFLESIQKHRERLFPVAEAHSE